MPRIGMAEALGVVRSQGLGASELASRSRGLLDGPLRGVAELHVSEIGEDALVLGAFERKLAAASPRVVVRRASGGPSVTVGEGTLYVALALAYPAALVPCEPARIVNRYVRPLLRALTKVGCAAHYFERDWISVAHRPAAWVGFAHDAGSGRAIMEAFVAVRTPFTEDDARASFLGKAPGTLESIAGKTFDLARVADAVVSSYAAAYARDVAALEPLSPRDRSGNLDVAASDPPWRATCEEAIGTLGAGPDARGVFRVGGELMASRDAIARLEERVGALPSDATEHDVGAVVDATLAAPGVALFGIKTLRSVVELIVRARVGDQKRT